MVYQLRLMRISTQTRRINRGETTLCISGGKNIIVNDIYVSNAKNNLFYKKIYCPECAEKLNII